MCSADASFWFLAGFGAHYVVRYPSGAVLPNHRFGDLLKQVSVSANSLERLAQPFSVQNLQSVIWGLVQL